MFERLDEDRNHSLDMKEIWNLFTENGIDITIEQCAEMFSVVSDIKNAYLMAEEESKGNTKLSNKKKDEKQGKELKLNLEDFHVVTSKSR